MIEFDPSEIDSWASKAEAIYQFPRLIRRLILSTISTPSLLSMPSGSAVWSSGWDGVLHVDNGNTPVPKGISSWEGIFGWELSATKKIKSKACDDYEKRTENPQNIDTATSTFVFATPRQWNMKEVWVKNRRQEGAWADVRVLDATDI